MNTVHPDPEDDSLKALFDATAADAALPDAAFLAALGERSAAEFDHSSPHAPREDRISEARRPEHSMLSAQYSVPSTQYPAPNHPSRFPLHFLIALAATAAVVMAGFFISQLSRATPKPVAQLTFGEVMANLAKVKSYQAEWTRDDGAIAILGSSHAIRIESAPSDYSIATHDFVLNVVESENRAEPRPWPSEFPVASTGIDPLRLWYLDSSTAASVLPTEKRLMNGRDYYVYTCSFEAPNRSEQIEALVDGETALPAFFTRTGSRHDSTLTPQMMIFTSFNQPLDPAKLVVSATLTEDGRIGKVTDWQGNVALRPMTSTRWTPVCDKPILRMGDWLRTDFSGANAVTVQLAPDTKLILGPGSLVELTKPDQITLHAGFAEIAPAPKADNYSGIVKLTGPNGSSMDVGSTVSVSTNDKGLVTNEKVPIWLASYKGSAISESLGSLVATIDGRRVPLTVGYHKVSVEIRDQIARTTIEESFVNHTDEVLEGQFHFPLPADASISGFGMWIGTTLVEADVVEKQRAREIYETILREKRDPGLLEWTGGNIFKARVYPIPAQGEKRIKIVYTQVLPKKGDSYRYSYALQSDLLRQNPLRQLDLEVTVASTLPLGAVTCPTHLTRNQIAEYAARVEFSAQNVAPTRDFEVVVETGGPDGAASAGPDVVFIPHQRGEDGYFLLQLQPPGEDRWQRDVLPDGDPLHLLVLADTSASMDASSRKTQAEVLASLLGSLAPQDTFNLAVCDIDCTWLFDQAQAADDKNVAQARETLGKRRSLGWTNLDRAFDAVAKQVKQGTQVVYLGDGIVTTADMDGPAFVHRLTQLVGGRGATLHAVAVSSSYDAAVLRGIAGIGGGSLRQVSGEVGPQQTAKNLLAEMTRPALKNIRLEFSGLRTARVYPRVLPNVPAGTQQIVLGRYQPRDVEQAGEVIVTGTLEGKLVTYRTEFRVQGSGFGVQRSEVVASTPHSAIRNPQSDASFIPRLWARLHLDELLAQGTSQEIQDEIINLSEEFHLITPYTSLLVLETDADRERFKVKRRFMIRDGERFFADARDVAQYQLVQQQMQRAGLWRRGLRERVLMSLAHFGRDQEQIEAVERLSKSINRGDVAGLIDSISNAIAPDVWRDGGGPGSITAGSNLSVIIHDSELAFGGVQFGQSSGGVAGAAGDLYEFAGRNFEQLNDVNGAIRILDDGFAREDAAPSLGPPILSPQADRPFVTSVIPVIEDISQKAEQPWFGPFDGTEANDGKRLDDFGSTLRHKREFAGDPFDTDGEGFRNIRIGAGFGWGWGGGYAGRSNRGRGEIAAKSRISLLKRRWDAEEIHAQARYLMPLLPIGIPPAVPPSAKPAERKSRWPAEAQELSRSLASKVELTKLPGGLVVREESRELDAHHHRLTSLSTGLRLASAKAWLARHETDGYDARLDWARGTQNGAERGASSLAYGVSLVRKAEPTDFPQEYDARAWWQSDIEWSFQDHTASIERPQMGEARLLLRHVTHPWREVRILIDTAKNVVLSAEWLSRGKVESAQRASDFVEIGGVWLPQKVEQLDGQGRVTHSTTRKFENVTQEQFDELLKTELAPTAAAVQVKLPLPRQGAAKEAIARGQATLEDRLVLLASLAADQKWPEAHAELARIEPLVAEKPFAVWMKIWLLEWSRRNEELRQLVLAEATKLAAERRPGERTLLERLENIASSHFSYEEQLAILEALKPIFARLPDHVQGPRLWGESYQRLLQSAGRDAEQLAVQRELVRDYPAEDYHYRMLARRLIEQGEFDAGYDVLKAALARPGANWSPRERDLLYEAWADHLKAQGRWADQAALVADWLKHNPEDADPYERYVACLVFTRREVEADALVAGWLKAGLAAGPLAKQIEAQVVAAVETATGDNSHMLNGDVDPRHLAAMAELLVAHAADEEQPAFLSEMSGDSDVRRTDEYRAAAVKLLGRLKAEAATLPLAKLQNLVAWCVHNADEATDDDWQAIAAAIKVRWLAAEEPPDGHPAVEQLLAGSLLSVLGQIRHSERLAFLRERLAASDDERRAGRASALFEALMEAAWTTEIEAELLALIDKLSSSDDPATRLRDQVVALHRWADRMEAVRYAALEAAIDRLDKLTRTELASKRMELRKQVLTDLAARLGAFVKGQSLALPAVAAAVRDDGLARWLTLERLTLEARLERDLAKVVEGSWELLGHSRPHAPREENLQGSTPSPAASISRSEISTVADQLDAVFRARVLTMLMRLAIRQDAPAAEAERLAKHLDAAIAADTPGLDARLAKYVLLVALDKPQPLAEQLAIWSKGNDRPQLWQRALGYLKAELGDLDGAIALFEPLAAADALGAADYRALAGWHQVKKQDDKHAAAQVAAWKQMDEYRLRQVVQAHLAPWQDGQGPAPTAIDPQLLLVLKALFEKSQSPAEHVYLVRSLYQKSRDFRLVAALADAVVGQSAGSIYGFLKELDTTLAEIDREATVDEMLAHVAQVRERIALPAGTAGQASSGTQAAVDQRALDFLTMLAEQRAAEVKNQPGPHVAAAVAALARATKPEWSPGEPRLFAQLLGDLGGISQKPLSDERIRVLRSLFAAAAGQSDVRLAIAHALATSLVADNRRQDAIDVLEPALAEHRAAHGGKLMASALDTLRFHGGELSNTASFIRAEAVYRAELPRAANRQVAAEIRQAIHQVQVNALNADGSTSLGRGLALYQGAQRQLIAELQDAAGQEERRRLVDRLCDLYEVAHGREPIAPAVKADVVRFGDELLPALLEQQIDNYQDLVQRVERTIRDTAGYLPALRFLITRIESEPAWLARRGDDGWRHFAWELGILHDEVRGKLGDLEPRLLKIVLTALRRDLSTQSDRRQVIYHRGSTHYWQEREADFVRVAEEVLAERPDSRANIMYISRYFHRGLARYDRAIEILLEAQRRGLLDEDGHASLVIWLQERGRFGESIGLLETLVKEHPPSLDYRIQLMRAYFQTKQPDALRKLLAETDKFFHESERWSEEVAAQLAMSTLENGLVEQAVEYLKEAIARREKSLNRQTTGDKALAQYYIDRASAWAELKNTKAAVDGACSAAVVWGAAGDGLYRRRFTLGSMTSEQVHPLDVLRHVLDESPNLEAYVADLDAEVAKTGTDRPIVRKSLGEVYFERQEFGKAVVQLKLAVELAPNDGAIHAKLVEAYDALMQTQQAAEQLFASVELARRDVELWADLAERLEKLEQPVEAERARTSLVEMLPTETEGHAKLAEIRQAQDRWDEAADHWRHVARLRKLEPAGLLGLAAAQIHQKQRGEAEKTLRVLETTDWPDRFDEDLQQKQLPMLREELSKLP